MQNSERTKKRKADLLLDSAKKCQKLSDLFGQTRQQAATTSPAASQLLTVVSQPTNQLSIVQKQVDLQNMSPKQMSCLCQLVN